MLMIKGFSTGLADKRDTTMNEI